MTTYLENVENIVGASLSKLIQDIVSLMSDVMASSQSSSDMHIHLPFTGGFESVFAWWFTNLSRHIAGFVTKLTAKFQNAQVANSSPEIAKYHISGPAEPVRLLRPWPDQF